MVTSVPLQTRFRALRARRWPRYAAGAWVLVAAGLVTNEASAQQADGSGGPVRTASASMSPSDRRDSGPEEIVVRARRRDELLTDIPVSVTALDAETLVDAQVTQLFDLQFLVPNLQVTLIRSGAGGSLRIRGVGPTESGNPGVGSYVDGVFIPVGGLRILNVVDVHQIEVLRGPQGTLFGKNTLGGAVNFVTSPPSEDVKGSVWLRGGSFQTFDTRVRLDVPIDIGALEDKVFTRWSFASSNSRGYTLNTATGEHFNDTNALWALGKTRILPVDGLEINVNMNYFQDQTNGGGGKCVLGPPGSGSIVGLLENFNPDFRDNCRRASEFRFATHQDTLYSDQNYGLWGNIRYDFGEVWFLDELSVKALGSWRKNRRRIREDVDTTVNPVIELTNIELAGVEGSPNRNNSSNLELQTFGTALDGDLDAILGFFHGWSDDTRADLIRTNPPFLDNVGGFTLGPVDRKDRDWAFYGQTTWDVFDWLALTAGIRYTSETRALDRTTIFPFGDGSTDEPVVTASAQGEKTFTQWTPMGSVQLTAPTDWLDDTPIEHLMTYFTYSNGFSSGGFNAVVGSGLAGSDLIPFDPSTIDNFEVGLKTTAFDDKVSFYLALFYSDYDDIQVTQSRTVEVPGQELPETARIIVNASSAVLKGIEAEFVVRPTDRLTVSGDVGLLDSSFGEFLDVSALDDMTPINRAGQTFDKIPNVTTHLALQYAQPVEFGPSWAQGTLTPRLDWYYQTETHNGRPEDYNQFVDPYHLVNLRVAYDFWDDRLTAALWGRNLADERYFQSGNGTTATFAYTVQYFAAPRSWGGELSFRF